MAGDGAGMVYVYRSEMKCLEPCRAGVCCQRTWPLLQKISVRDMVCGLSPTTPNAVPFKCDLDPHFGILPPHRFGHTVSITSDSGTIAIGELWDRSTLSSSGGSADMQESQAYVLRITVADLNSVSNTNVKLYSYLPDQILTR